MLRRYGTPRAFVAAIDGGLGWLAASAAANTVASVFYCLCWIVPMCRAPDGLFRPARTASRTASLVAVGAAAFSVLLGAGAGIARAV